MIGERAEESRVRCEASRDMLRELARLHLRIDAANRPVRTDDPDWILRLRKVCLHARAISGWGINADSVHAMATELRAAYVQMDSVWRCVPEGFRIDRLDGSFWASEARDGLLATYDHPTPLSLQFPLAQGGFGNVEDPVGYVRLFVWLAGLGVGYALSLTYLAQVLRAEGDVVARVAEVVRVASADWGGRKSPQGIV